MSLRKRRAESLREADYKVTVENLHEIPSVVMAREEIIDYLQNSLQDYSYYREPFVRNYDYMLVRDYEYEEYD